MRGLQHAMSRRQTYHAADQGYSSHPEHAARHSAASIRNEAQSAGISAHSWFEVIYLYRIRVNGLYLESLRHCHRVPLLPFTGHSVIPVRILYCTLNCLHTSAMVSHDADDIPVPEANVSHRSYCLLGQSSVKPSLAWSANIFSRGQ